MGRLKNKTIIIDDCFELSTLLDFKNTLGDSNIPETWYKKKDNHLYSDYCNLLLSQCQDYYDLSDCVGYEFWTQNNTRPSDWHYDKDEDYFNQTGSFKFPICSIVYYLNVNNLVGGLLHLEDCIILPKTNRMVIFPPGTVHYVEEFTGERTSILVNPWDYNLVSE